MELKEIKKLLNAKVCCGEDRLNESVSDIFASDMMSDVLAGNKANALLMTGLVNVQVIRTAEMLDIFCIVMVRAKQPTQAMIEFASENNMVIMTTEMSMFDSCGILYKYINSESAE